MTQHPKPLSEVVGLPDTDQRKWTIYVCPSCGTVSDSPAECRFHGLLPMVPDPDRKTYPEAIEVVPAEALSVEREGRERLEAALEVAADDLGKAANQFASMRESQKAGHNIEIVSNPGKFAGKEARARDVLTSTPRLRRGESRDHGDGAPEAESSSRSVALEVAADLRKWAEDERLTFDSDLALVHRAKLLSRAARLDPTD